MDNRFIHFVLYLFHNPGVCKPAPLEPHVALQGLPSGSMCISFSYRPEMILVGVEEADAWQR